MTNYRQILRLHSLGINKTQIAQSCGCSRTTVIQVLRRQRSVACVIRYLRAYQIRSFQIRFFRSLK